MSESDEEKRLRIELMRTQIELYTRQARWETLKALAVLLSTMTAMAALILTVAHFIK